MNRKLLIGLVAAVFLFGADGMMLMAVDTESPYRIQWYADGQPSTPPPGIDPDAPMPAPLPPDAGDYFKKTAAAPGKRLFNQLYGSSGFGSTESDCPEGQCPSGQCPSEPIQSEHAEIVEKPVIAVYVNGASGFIAATGKRDVAVLTAYHVVEGHPTTGIPVRGPDGTKWKAEIVLKKDGSHAVDKAADIALIRYSTKRDMKPYCSLADRQPDVGDPVWSSGYGPGNVYRRIPGKVLEFNEHSYGKRPCGPDSIMVVSGEAQAGDSGGPIFNSNGLVVGIVSRSTRQTSAAVKRTWSTSLNSIGALCADSLFPFPWRRDVERELEEAKQLPVPYPPDPQRSQVSFVSTQIEADLAALSERLAKAEAQIAELTGKEPPKPFDDKSLSTSVAAAKTTADAAEKAATEAKTELTRVETAAKTQAETATKERGVIRKMFDSINVVKGIRKFLPANSIGGTIWWALLSVGLGIAAFFGRRAYKWVKSDIDAFLDGSDPLWLRETLERAAKLTSTKIDDKFVAMFMDAVEAILLAIAGRRKR